MHARYTVSALVALATVPVVGTVPGETDWFGSGATLAAQQPPAAERPTLRAAPARGWLGVELVQEVGEPAGSGDRPRVRVASVVPGSPAESAGLRSGDLVLELDGRAVTAPALVRLATTLQPGAQAELLVERDGERRALTVRAAERPLLMGFDGRPISPDSLATRVRVHLDSVRLELERARVPSVSVSGVSPLVVEGKTRTFEGAAPFLHRQEFQVDTLVAVIRGDPSGAPRVVTVRRPTVAEQRLTPPPSPPRAATRPPPVPAVAGGAPRIVLALGQRAVAGAELMALNPSLGRYFGVEQGVLAVEVVRGTPAYLAGLRPGDVIVAVAGEEVREVDEVRSALARGYTSPPVPLTIIRDGAERILELTR
jgi:membrane-associated protease RseP (regulator of RpoE activity)